MAECRPVSNPSGGDVSLAPGTTLYSGQVTVAAAHAPLSAVSVPIISVTIENVDTNNVVYVGPDGVTTANGYGLRAGASVTVDIDDLNKVYVVGTAGNIVTYLALA